jgi:hypothetical protein
MVLLDSTSTGLRQTEHRRGTAGSWSRRALQMAFSEGAARGHCPEDPIGVILDAFFEVKKEIPAIHTTKEEIVNKNSTLQSWGTTVLRVVVGIVFLMMVAKSCSLMAFMGSRGFWPRLECRRRHSSPSWCLL